MLELERKRKGNGKKIKEKGQERELGNKGRGLGEVQGWQMVNNQLPPAWMEGRVLGNVYQSPWCKYSHREAHFNLPTELVTP